MCFVLCVFAWWCVLFFEYLLVLFGLVFCRYCHGFVHIWCIRVGFAIGLLMLLLFNALVPAMRILWSFSMEVKCLFAQFFKNLGKFKKILIFFEDVCDFLVDCDLMFLAS